MLQSSVCFENTKTTFYVTHYKDYFLCAYQRATQARRSRHVLITNLYMYICYKRQGFASYIFIYSYYMMMTNCTLTIACSILLSIATALVPDALQNREKKENERKI